METPKLLTDDMDIRDTELSMYHGNNGDYYICLKETKGGEIVKLDTRIAMSGGNATPEIRQAVSNLFKALMGQKVDTGENNALLPDVNSRYKVNVLQKGKECWRYTNKETRAKRLQLLAKKNGLCSYVYQKTMEGWVICSI